jgi:hypothetical protein
MESGWRRLISSDPCANKKAYESPDKKANEKAND